MIDQVLSGKSGLPAERVQPEKGELIWFIGA